MVYKQSSTTMWPPLMTCLPVFDMPVFVHHRHILQVTSSPPRLHSA